MKSFEEQLMYDCFLGDVSGAVYCLSHGADIHYNNDIAIRVSAEHGYIRLVECLIERGANINAMGGYSLIYSIRNGHLPVVICLLKHGANLNVLSPTFDIGNNYPEVVKYVKRFVKIKNYKNH
jgi:ankyrin repeat protein